MQSQEPEEGQLHPALPHQIMAEEKEKWDNVYSDHVPILSSIPFPESKNSAIKQINMITWNVLDQDTANALAKGNNKDCGETSEQQEARHDRIAKSLASMVSQNKPIHLMTLQEAADGESFIEKVQKELGPTWKFAPNLDAASITFYDTTYFSSARKVTVQEFAVDPVLGPNLNELILKESHQSLMVCNCHGEFSHSSIKHEKAIDNVLSQGSDQRKVIVAGDFNVTCMPTHRDATNIATAATPSKFSVDGKQGINSLDACFYSAAHDNKSIASQAVTEPLNPVTGKKYTQSELVFPLENISEDREINHVGKMRMGINISNQQINNNGTSLAEYEEYLRKSFPFDTVFLLPKGTDRLKVAGRTPQTLCLTKVGEKVYIDIVTVKGTIVGNPKELKNYDIKSLSFPSKIMSSENQSLVDQIRKDKPTWQPSFYVREATNMRNERGLAVQMPGSVYNGIKSRLPKGLEFNDGPPTIILCKKENIEQLNYHLHTAMQYYNSPIMDQIDNSVSALTKYIEKLNNKNNKNDAIYTTRKDILNKMVADLEKIPEGQIQAKINLINATIKNSGLSQHHASLQGVTRSKFNDPTTSIKLLTDYRDQLQNLVKLQPNLMPTTVVNCKDNIEAMLEITKLKSKLNDIKKYYNTNNVTYKGSLSIQSRQLIENYVKSALSKLDHENEKITMEDIIEACALMEHLSVYIKSDRGLVDRLFGTGFLEKNLSEIRKNAKSIFPDNPNILKDIQQAVNTKNAIKNNLHKNIAEDSITPVNTGRNNMK